MLGRVLRQACCSSALQRGSGMLALSSRTSCEARLAAAQRQRGRLAWTACAVQRQHPQQQPLHGQQLAAAKGPPAATAAGWWQQQPWRRLSSAAGTHGNTRRGPPPANAEAAAQAAQAPEDEDADAVGVLGDGEDDDFLDDLEELEEDVKPETSTGGVEWGEKALAVVQQLLTSGANAELADIQLFSFRAIPSSKRLDIRLDKLTDQYGSPSLEDVAAFSRLFNAAYEAAIGEAAAGEIEVEVSSPGAERQVRVPAELQRFADLPMKVEYSLQEDKVETKVLSFTEYDAAAAMTRWRLADVRVNRTGGKGRGLNRKQRDAVYELPLATLRRVNLHIDF